MSQHNKNCSQHPTNVARLRTALVVMLSIILPNVLQAQDWSLDPAIRVGGEYDDNGTLATRTDEEIDLKGYLAEGELTIDYSSPATTFFLTPRVRFARYSDQPDYDQDDQFARGEWNHDTQNSTFNVRLRYARQGIRTAERGDADFDVDDPDDISDDETNAVDATGRRQKLEVRPEWEYRLSDVSTFVTRFDYQDVDYEQSLAVGGLTDYTDSRIRLAFERELSARNIGVLSATYRNYDAVDALDDTAGIGLQVGLIRDITQSSRFSALVGFEQTDRAAGENDERVVYNFSYTRRLQTITLVAQYRRNVNASGAGRLTARDEINLRFTRQLTERFSAGLGVRGYTTNGLNEFEFSERDYLQLRSRFTWSLTPKLELEADYRYTFLRRSSLDESANSNNVMLWLTYRPTSEAF